MPISSRYTFWLACLEINATMYVSTNISKTE